LASQTLFFASLAAGAAFGQFIPGRFIVELNQPLAARTPNGMAQARAAQTPARARVAALGGQIRESMAAVTNALIVDLPEGVADEVAALPV